MATSRGSATGSTKHLWSAGRYQARPVCGAEYGFGHADPAWAWSAANRHRGGAVEAGSSPYSRGASSRRPSRRPQHATPGSSCPTTTNSGQTAGHSHSTAQSHRAHQCWCLVGGRIYHRAVIKLLIARQHRQGLRL